MAKTYVQMYDSCERACGGNPLAWELAELVYEGDASDIDAARLRMMATTERNMSARERHIRDARRDARRIA